MLSVQIVCVGKLKEDYWREACAEYTKRLQPFCRFHITELPEARLEENASRALIDSALEHEGEKILAAASGSVQIALCIEGKELSSEAFAAQIGNWCLNGESSLSFIIGSSFGLSSRVKQAADYRLSMSPMTFPHQLARVMLCEQIYRVFQILNHGKYHK